VSNIILLALILVIVVVVLAYGHYQEKEGELRLRCSACYRSLKPPVAALEVTVFELKIPLFICDSCIVKSTDA